MNPTTVVIGANSFLGQKIIEKEILLNHQVFGVYHKNVDRLLEKVPYYSLEEFYSLNKRVDVIYMVSAYVPDGNIDQENLFKVNVRLVKEISTLFPDAKIILASSVSVYQTTENVITEKSTVSPVSAYGISKLWAEQILKEHKNYSIVRISSMYGLGMKLNTFLPRIIVTAIKENKIILFGDGSRLQNYVSVNHVADVMVKSAYTIGNHIFLAVGSSSVSNKGLATCVKQINNDLSIEYKGEDNSPSFVYNDDLTKKILGISERLSLESEIKKIWNWLKEF